MSVVRFGATRSETRRWCGTGCAGGTDPRLAGRLATAEATDGRTAELLVVFAPPALSEADLLAGVAEAAQGTPVIGCSAASQISDHGVSDDQVVVLALGGEGFTAAIAAAQGHGDARAVGRSIADALRDPGEPGTTAIVLTSTLTGDQSELVRGAYGVLGGGVPLVGGCAGACPAPSTSRQFHGTSLVQDGAVGARLRSDGAVGIGVDHGYQRIGRPMVVTRAQGGEVLELEGRPALDVYLEALGLEPDTAPHPQGFSAFAVGRPLLVNRHHGVPPARCISGADYARRSLRCVAGVPQGSIVFAASTDTTATLRAARRACRRALEGLGGRPPRALLIFDSLDRRHLLGASDTAREFEIFREAAGGAPVAGLYTLGEIARIRGISGFHNTAVVTVAIG
jgi:hypothetical protein